MLQALLESSEPEEYARQFHRWWRSDPDKRRLQRQLVDRLAVRCYREDYAAGAPSEMAGLGAAIQAGGWLPAAIQMDPLAQALWNALESRPMPDFSFDLPETSVTALLRPLEDLWRERDIPALCAAIDRAAASPARESLGAWLISQALSDQWQSGRRLLLTAWSARFCQWADWQGASRLLFPAIHFSMLAPTQMERAEWLGNLLAHNPVRQDHVAGQGAELTADQLDTLTRLIMTDFPDRLINESLRILSDGASIGALYEGLLLTAARLIQQAAPDDWREPVWGFLYLEALGGSLEESEPCQQVEALLLAALLLQATAAELGDPGPDFCVLDVPAAEGAPSTTVWADLAAALDDADVTGALWRLGAAQRNGADERSLSAFFASYTARNDGRLYQAHNLQLMCAILTTHAQAISSQKDRLLATLVRFLAHSRRDHSLWRLLGEQG